MQLTREEFVAAIEAAIEESEMPDEPAEKLREVGRTSPGCAVGHYGLRFSEFPPNDLEVLGRDSLDIREQMCPVRQADLEEYPELGAFASAFDAQISLLSKDRADGHTNWKAVVA